MTVAASERLRGRTRWSAASRCPRWAALGLLGHEPAEPSDRTKRIWLRGRQLGEYVADKYALRFGLENVERERAVPWPGSGFPLGELHTDVFIVSERLAVEVKSSATPESLLEAAFTQLAGEVHFDPEAERGALHIVNPIDLEDTVYPFVLTAEYVAKVEQIAGDIAAAGRTGTLPPCSCDSPSACHFMGCPFTAEAWKDWTPPPLEPLDDDTAEVARTLLRVKDDRAAAKVTVDVLDAEWKELVETLVARGLEPGREYVTSDGVSVKLAAFAGRETFSLSKARKAGVWNPALDEMLGAFVSVGDGHVRATVKPTLAVTDCGPVDLDFGDEAPF